MHSHGATQTPSNSSVDPESGETHSITSTNLEIIQILLELARRQAHAQSYSLYQVDTNLNRLVWRLGERTDSKWPAASQTSENTSNPVDETSTVLDQSSRVFPLQGQNGLMGIVEFELKPGAELQAAGEESLLRAVRIVEAMLSASERRQQFLELAQRIITATGALADMKIRERAQGLMDAKNTDCDWDALYQHVTNILQDDEVELAWKTQCERVEERLQERQTVSRAKAHLQRTQGLTEEAAYLYLRRISRGSRVKIGDVAAAVLDGSIALSRKMIA